MSSRKIAKAAVLITILAVISKFFGLIREIILAHYYGISTEMDAYVVAVMIPTVLGSVIRACIITAFIPIYNGYLAQKEHCAAKRLADTSLTLIVVVSIVVGIILCLFASPLITMMAPGFSTNLHQLTVSLLRITMPIMLFFSILGLINAIQQSQDIFVYPAIVGLTANLVIILLVVGFAEKIGIYAAALGSVIAVVMQVIIQWPGLRKCNYYPQFAFDYNHPGIRKMAILLGPILLGTAATQANLFVDRFLASFLPTGSIAALNYANKINTVFINLFVMSLITVTFPSLSKFAAQGETNAFKRSLSTSIRIVLYITMPIVTALMIFNNQVVELLLQRGAFDKVATQATSYALFFFSVGMVGMSLVEILNRAFYALQETKIPAIVNIGVVGLNILFNIILIPYLAHGGLALGTSIAVTIGVIILLKILRRKLGNFGEKRLSSTLIKTMVAATIMGVVTFFLYYYIIVPGVYQLWPSNQLAKSIAFVLAIVVGGLVYIASTLFMRCEELLFVLELLSGKIPFMGKIKKQFFNN